MALPRALLLSALLAITPDRAVAAADCADFHAEVTLQADAELAAVLSPQQAYVGWIEETGVDAQLQSDIGITDSSPGGHAREPFALHSDDRGRLPLRLTGVGVGDVLVLQAVCVQRRTPSQQRAWRRLLAAAEALGAYSAQPGGLAGLRASGQLLWAKLSAKDPVQRLWLDQQSAALARSADQAGLAAGFYRLVLAQPAEALSAPARAKAALGLGQMGLLGHAADAEAQLLSAEQTFTELGLARWAVIAAHDRCLLQRLANRSEAVDCLGDAAIRFAAMGDRTEQLNALRNQVTALLYFGQFARAQTALDSAQQLADELDDTRQQALLGLLQAQRDRAAGRFEPALRQLERAAEVFLQRNDMLLYGQTQRLIGMTYTLSGEAARALSFYRRAGEVFQQRGLHARVAALRLTEARTLAALGRHNQAAELLQALHSEFDRPAAAADQARARLMWLDQLLVLGRTAEAADLLQLPPPGGSEWSLEQQRQRHRLRLRLNPAPSAEAVVELQEEAERAWQAGQVLRYSEDWQLAVETQVRRGQSPRALVDQGRERLLPIAAAIRSPALRQALISALQHALVWELPSSAHRLQPDQVQRWVGGLQQLRSIALREPDAGDSEQLDRLEREIGEDLLAETAPSEQRDRLHSDWLQWLQRQSAHGVPPLSSLPPIGKGQRWLQPLLSQGRGGWLIGETQGWRWLPLDDATGLPEAIRQLRRRLAAGHGDQAAAEGEMAALVQRLRLPELLPDASVQLYVVGEPWLAALPLEWALERLQPGTRLSWLQTLQPISVAPVRELRLLAAAHQADLAASLPQLAAADSELDRVAALWSLPQRRAAPANRSELLSALASEQALVHIAAHAVAARALDEESGLWLQDGESGRAQFVSALRLRSLPVRASLVVLSACDTGHSGAQSVFGMGGVAGSLSSAGATRVVGSRWPVSDRAAQVFAVALHQALSKRPLAASAAVEQARAAVRSQPALRHPSHWAGWFLLQSGAQIDAP